MWFKTFQDGCRAMVFLRLMESWQLIIVSFPIATRSLLWSMKAAMTAGFNISDTLPVDTLRKEIPRRLGITPYP
jgi:hypothetical protein